MFLVLIAFVGRELEILGPRTTKDLICVAQSAVFAIDLSAMSLLAN